MQGSGWRGALPVVLAAAAAVIVPSAAAKGRISLVLGVGHPTTAQTVRATLRVDFRTEPDQNLRLFAVAPGSELNVVVRALDGGEALKPRLGFAVGLTRTGVSSWRGSARFPRAGRWLLVVPNGPTQGYMLPPPVIRTVVVSAP
jgi:hypothetical protein